MSDQILFLRTRAFIGIVIIVLLCPFVMVWKAAPGVWEEVVPVWDWEFAGTLEVAWAIVRWGKDAKDHTNVRFKT